jgi:LytS/YehU family sensor histidine kinase
MGNDYVAFEGEMNSVKDYLEIEHLRFSDKFDYTIDYSEIENPEIIEVFPGLIQPFIENAIWHGVRALEKGKGLIRIRMTGTDNHKVTCIIDDDGIGRKRSGEMRSGYENHDSKGIAIVKERLQIISILRNTNYCLEISDLYHDKAETGTKVEIDIPCRVLQ